MASLPFFRFTATVSSDRVDLERRQHHAVFKPLEPGLYPWCIPLPAYLLRAKLNIEHPLRKKT